MYSRGHFQCHIVIFSYIVPVTCMHVFFINLRGLLFLSAKLRGPILLFVFYVYGKQKKTLQMGGFTRVANTDIVNVRIEPQGFIYTNKPFLPRLHSTPV